MGEETTMTYYDDVKIPFSVDGRLVWMTEDEAEQYQDENPWVDIQSVNTVEPLTVEGLDDIIDCTCEDEYDICPACQKFFEEFADD